MLGASEISDMKKKERKDDVMWDWNVVRWWKSCSLSKIKMKDSICGQEVCLISEAHMALFLCYLSHENDIKHLDSQYLTWKKKNIEQFKVKWQSQVSVLWLCPVIFSHKQPLRWGHGDLNGSRAEPACFLYLTVIVLTMTRRHCQAHDNYCTMCVCSAGVHLNWLNYFLA